MRYRYSLFAAGFLLFLFTAAASAGPILSGTVNGVQFCATDNNSPCLFGTQLIDTNPLAGNLTLANVTLAGVSVQGSVQQQIIGPTQDVLNSSSLQIINANATTISAQVAVGGIGFIGPTTNIVTSGSGTFQNAIGSSITQVWYADQANGTGAEAPNDFPGTLLATCTSNALLAADAFACSGGPFPFVDPDLFSMTQGFSLSLIGGGSLVNRGQTEIAAITAVPEPATMLLMGTGLIAAFRSRRNRRS